MRIVSWISNLYFFVWKLCHWYPSFLYRLVPKTQTITINSLYNFQIFFFVFNFLLYLYHNYVKLLRSLISRTTIFIYVISDVFLFLFRFIIIFFFESKKVQFKYFLFLHPPIFLFFFRFFDFFHFNLI